jgi:DNA-binding transcriptional MerR regulator
MSSELLSIGELGRRTGAPASTLRYWERAGLLEVDARVGGRRRYSPAAVARVGLIRLCQDAGFGIGEIRDLLDADPPGTGAWKAHAEKKLVETRQRIVELQAATALLEHTLACPEPSLGVCPTFTAFVDWRSSGGTAPFPRVPQVPRASAETWPYG